MSVQRDWFQAMPKVELHLHIDGALQTQTAWELWQELSEEERRQHPEFPRDWWSLSQALGNRSIRGTQEALLQAFEWPSLLLQSAKALARVTRELLQAKASEGVIYCELRYAPALHTQRGCSIQEGLEAVLQAMQESQSRLGIRSQLIVCGMRHFTLEQNLDWLRKILPYRSQGVVAVDFAGLEARYPDPREQLPFFLQAREQGFGLTFHGGEIWTNGEILEQSVRAIQPDRIAHGSTLFRSSEAVEYLREHGIALDLCPTSNVQAGLYESYEAFPFSELQAKGVPVTLSTDDLVVSRLTLVEEYENLYAAGTSLRTLLLSNVQAARAAFLPREEASKLEEEIVSWYRLALGEDWEKRAECPPCLLR